MSEAKILLVLQGEGEGWETSLLLSKTDARHCLHLLNTGRDQDRLDLPSLDGFVELRPGTEALLGYHRRELILVNRHRAKDALSEALRNADEPDLDEGATADN